MSSQARTRPVRGPDERDLEMESGEITRQLIACRSGEREAMDRLFEMVYDRLRRISRGQLGRGDGRATLDTTALVHEAYLKLVDAPSADWRDRNHFFAVAAKAMRQILVDHVRKQRATKRGGDLVRTDLTGSALGLDDRIVELLELNDAMEQLAGLDSRLSHVVELRFFGGLSFEEVGSVLGVNERTARRDWRKARSFLFAVLKSPKED